MEKIKGLSIIILTKNESKIIEKLLHDVSWGQECIIVDNGSTDDTVQIARKSGANVIVDPTPDFSVLRNRGAEAAQGPWLFYLDTDEEVTHELHQEIANTIAHFDEKKDIPAYTIKRKNFYFGTQWPLEDGMIRFIFKPRLTGWFGKIHETATIQGSVGTLTNTLVHRTHSSLEEMVEKTNDWSEIEAKLRLDAHHPKIVPWRVIRMFVTEFFHSFITQKGYKVGTIGLLESMYQGFSVSITYCKLWELQQKAI